MSRSALKRATGVVGLAVAAMLILGLALPSSAFASSRPVVAHLSPVAGPSSGGTTVTITGHSFVKVTKVRFGTRAATHVKVKSHTRITATAPAGSGTVSVRVTTRAGVSSASSKSKYTYYVAATVTGVSPAAGSTLGGTSVTITGTHFSGATAVKFGATAAAVVHGQLQHLDHSRGSRRCRRQRRREGDQPRAGPAPPRRPICYTYFVPATVTGLSPASGPTAGGTPVTITGTNFSGATAVKFGATAATLFTVSSSNLDHSRGSRRRRGSRGCDGDHPGRNQRHLGG